MLFIPRQGPITAPCIRSCAHFETRPSGQLPWPSRPGWVGPGGWSATSVAGRAGTLPAISGTGTSIVPVSGQADGGSVLSEIKKGGLGTRRLLLPLLLLHFAAVNSLLAVGLRLESLLVASWLSSAAGSTDAERSARKIRNQGRVERICRIVMSIKALRVTWGKLPVQKRKTASPMRIDFDFTRLVQLPCLPCIPGLSQELFQSGKLSLSPACRPFVSSWMNATSAGLKLVPVWGSRASA